MRFRDVAVPMLLTEMAIDPGDIETISKRVVRQAYAQAFGDGDQPPEAFMEALRQTMLLEAALAASKVLESATFYMHEFLPRLLPETLPGRKHDDFVSFVAYTGAAFRFRFTNEMRQVKNELEKKLKENKPKESLAELLLQAFGMPAKTSKPRVEFVSEEEDLPPIDIYEPKRTD